MDRVMGLVEERLEGENVGGHTGEDQEDRMLVCVDQKIRSTSSFKVKLLRS